MRNFKKYRRINIEYIDTDKKITDSLIKLFIKFILESCIRLLSLYRISPSL
jgi:hypothetical protein